MFWYFFGNPGNTVGAGDVPLQLKHAPADATPANRPTSVVRESSLPRHSSTGIFKAFEKSQSPHKNMIFPKTEKSENPKSGGGISVGNGTDYKA